MTRISELMALDDLRLPVCCAVTPLARDLTTHLGKGPTPLAARVSAVMEAVERVSAEDVPAAAMTVRASFVEMRSRGLNAADPEFFGLPPRTSYGPDAVCDWVEGWDLLKGTPVWILADLARSPDHEGVLGHVDTNGLASGNTFLEATLHGLCEVIERDAVGQKHFVEVFAERSDGAPPCRRINLGSVPASTGAFVRRAVETGLDLVATDLTGDISVATFACVLADHAYPSPEGPETHRFAGYGCHPDAEIALNRAILEAIQARLGVIQGARDSFNRRQGSPRPAARWGEIEDMVPVPTVPFWTVPSFQFDDIAEEIEHVFFEMRRAGFDRVVVVDLSRPDLGVPVVRVRAARLTSYLMDRQRVGWRCLRYLL